MAADQSNGLILNESGSVIYEWTIVSLGVLFGMLIALDTSQALNYYFTLTQLANEGLRFSATLPEIEDGVFEDLVPTPEELTACALRQPTAFSCNHYFIHERVRAALNHTMTFSSPLTTPNQITIRTEFVPDGAGTPTDDNTVSIEVRALLDGVIIRGMPLVADHRSRYLAGDL